MTTLERTPPPEQKSELPPTSRLNRDALQRGELEQARAQGRYAAQSELLRWVGAVAVLLLITAAVTGSGVLLAGGVLALLIVSPIMLASSVTAGRLAERDARLEARRRRQEEESHAS